MSTAENPFAGQGAVLLDIGDDIGALVVTMPAAMVDTEVEIRPVGVVAHHSHGGHGHLHDHGFYHRTLAIALQIHHANEHPIAGILNAGDRER